MERLTERNEYGVYYPYCDSAKGCGGHCASCEFERKITKKLAEYEDAEEQGLLLRLPCNVGDTLYLSYSRPRYIKEVMVTDFMFNGCDLHILTDFVTLGNRDIGKTVFLTKEEAEQALEERNGV